MSFSGFPSNRPFAFNFRVPPPGNPSPSTADVCHDCASLDLETALAQAHTLYEGARRGLNTRRLVSSRSRNGPTYLRDFYFVASLGSRLSEDRSCKLCSLFKQHVDDPAMGTYKVLAICSSETRLFEPLRKSARGKWIKRPWRDLEYNVFLAVVPEVAEIPRTGVPLRWLELDLPRKGSIYRLTEELSDEEAERLVLPGDLGSRVDLESVGYWMYTCSTSHGSCCAPKKPLGATLRGFRAINCMKNPVDVEDVPWSDKYVALSYVWGSGTERWPQTIKDAVMVTKMLGHKYLWVDRLCIDQSNSDEKRYLFSRMDAIYEGAEFTIVNAAGDARTGLPGVGKTPRKPQPRVELDLPKGKSVDRSSEDDIYLYLLNVPKVDYDKETAGHSVWLDTYRHGLNRTMKIDLNEFTEAKERMQRYGIARDQLDFHEDSADHFGRPFDEYMAIQQELARQKGMELHELVPFLQREAAKKAGKPIPDDQPVPPLGHANESPITDPNKPERPLPPGKVPGKTVLVSTMQEPRVTIRKSQWATRGWTYQEGVLSRRCLVFTPEQVYWECRGMAVNESVQLPIPSLEAPSKSGTHWHFADYMLSGILRGDMHRAPELQYGFQQDDNSDNDVAAQVKTLDGHIRSFASRKLSKPEDSWNAFLGVATRYVASGQGLSLLLGIPFWAGSFADGQPALQHSFAMSISIWFHIGRPAELESKLYVANCPRRTQFPSWSWIGWEGRVDFNGDDTADAEKDLDDDDCGGDNAHINFFDVMMKPEWSGSVDRIWCADMILHSEDGNDSTLLQGNVPLQEFADPNKRWLLTIKQPFVLKHLYLMHSKNNWEWRRLMGKLVELHLSVPLTEQELTAGHKSGDIATVLIFASTVPYVYDGRARFLILRKLDAGGKQWERIGRLELTMEEWRMHKYGSSQDMIDDLPVRKFGRDFTLV